MKITFVSECQNKALKRTRRVLDGFATRIGAKTWIAHITLDGLTSVRQELSKTATKNTAVAAFDFGKKHVELLWVVGNAEAFSDKGVYPVATISRKSSGRIISPVSRIIGLLGAICGLSHDLGKASNGFQNMIRNSVPDNARHEWLSLCMLDSIFGSENRITLAQQKTWVEHWNNLTVRKNAPDMVDSVFKSVQVIVSTHHAPYAPEKDLGPPDSTHHLRERTIDLDNEQKKLFSESHQEDFNKILSKIVKTFFRANRLSNNYLESITKWSVAGYYEGITLLARAGLILADHTISSGKSPLKKECQVCKTTTKWQLCKTCIYANTKRNGNSEVRTPDQPLFWHLGAVGKTAGEYAFRYGELLNSKNAFQGFSEKSLEVLRSETEVPVFLWQNEAVNAVRKFKNEKNTKGPVLVFNLAGTGSGKTLTNMKLVAALTPEESPVRATIALNLITLTTQTKESLVENSGIEVGDVERIGGSYTRIQLLKYLGKNGEVKESEDGELFLENEKLLSGEVEENKVYRLPDWLKDSLNLGPYRAYYGLLGAPLLVTTTDHIISAGDLCEQGHHALSLIRVATSDLILDEIDEYDPDALIAILRIVRLSAFFGRSVICSSATILDSVAKAVYSAFESGLNLRRCVLGGDYSVNVSIVDDLCEPQTFSFQSGNESLFIKEYAVRLLKIRKKLSEKSVTRIMELVNFKPTREDFIESIVETTKRMHERHKWNGTIDGEITPPVSFGVIRIANVNTCQVVASEIAKRMQEKAVVATYHAREILLQRTLKEVELDTLLIRKNPEVWKNLGRSRQVRKILESGKYPEGVIFIVVATPVEEVGRDHDFDWGIIEPSSARSIIQLGGRVNRHRRHEILEPNIGLLKFNMRHIKNLENGKSDDRCFVRPGFENKNVLYPHDVEKLFKWSREQVLPVDSRLADTTIENTFAHLDNESINKKLVMAEKARNKFNTVSLWSVQAFYKDNLLRNIQKQESWRLSRNEIGAPILQKLKKTTRGWEYVDEYNSNVYTEPLPNMWLYNEAENLIEIGEQYNKSESLGAKIQIYNPDFKYSYKIGFGFCEEKKIFKMGNS